MVDRSLQYKGVKQATASQINLQQVTQQPLQQLVAFIIYLFTGSGLIFLYNND